MPTCGPRWSVWGWGRTPPGRRSFARASRRRRRSGPPSSRTWGSAFNKPRNASSIAPRSHDLRGSRIHEPRPCPAATTMGTATGLIRDRARIRDAQTKKNNGTDCPEISAGSTIVRMFAFDVESIFIDRIFPSYHCRMNATTLQDAADFLWSTWQARQIIDELPAAIRPASRAQGYAIQSLLERRTTKPLFGWKIAATAAAGQKHIGVDRPLAGRLLAERVRADGAAISLAGNRMRVAECEFAFRLARDLGPRPQGYVVAEVMAAVATLHPSI